MVVPGFLQVLATNKLRETFEYQHGPVLKRSGPALRSCEEKSWGPPNWRSSNVSLGLGFVGASRRRGEATCSCTCCSVRRS